MSRSQIARHRRSKFRTVALLALSSALLSGVTSVAAAEIKMATLSPENSPWDVILKEMGKEWSDGTEGRVTLTVYPGGVVGDEPDILRKMRFNQYQAAALSVSGLVDLDEFFTVFEIPLFYRSFDELSHVMETLSPILKERLEQKGIIVLGWGYVGWVHFFTTKPVSSVDDMKALKIFTWAGDDAMVQWWRRNGFQPVALAATDIMAGLQTGMIEAVSVPPLYASQVQFFKQAKYMADVGLAPLIGAIVINKRAWDKVSRADQAVLRAAGEAAQKKVFDRIPKLDTLAVTMMSNQGLEVLKIKGTEAAKEWVAAAEMFANDMRGDIVPIEIFDKALAARDAFRAQAEASSEGSP